MSKTMHVMWKTLYILKNILPKVGKYPVTYGCESTRAISLNLYPTCKLSLHAVTNIFYYHINEDALKIVSKA